MRVKVRGEQMPVASFADIIWSKEAAARPKDFTALSALQERLIAQQGTLGPTANPRRQRPSVLRSRAERGGS